MVEGIAWPQNLTTLVGESGTGKSSVLLNLASATDTGLPFHGLATVQCSFVYVLFEGDAINLRIRAVLQHTSRTLRHLHVIRASHVLSPTVTRDGEVPSRAETELVATLQQLATDLRVRASHRSALLPSTRRVPP